jgi:hypothetical protein
LGVTRRTTTALVCALVCAFLPGCGGGSHQHGKASAGSSSSRNAKASPRYSAAKRRYLANFEPNCAAGASGAEASSEYIQRLIEQSSHGDIKALPELIIYLNHLAGAFESALRQARSFGVPPNPDSSYGIAYFKDSEQVIGAIRDLSKSVANIDAKGVTSSVDQLASATAAAKSDGQRYGMPMCPSGHSGHSPLLGGQAI